MARLILYIMAFDGAFMVGIKGVVAAIVEMIRPLPADVWESREFDAIASMEAMTAYFACLLLFKAALFLKLKERMIRVCRTL